MHGKTEYEKGGKLRKWEKVGFSYGKIWRLRYTAFRASEV